MTKKPPDDPFADADAFARGTDPSTSHLAAYHVDAATLERIVWEALWIYGPMTSTEICEKTGHHAWGISPRLKPLETKGLVERIGFKYTPRKQILWRAIRSRRIDANTMPSNHPPSSEDTLALEF